MVGLNILFVANFDWIAIGEENYWCPLCNHCQIFKALFDFFIKLFLVQVKAHYNDLRWGTFGSSIIVHTI
jgi:hypothetical protein